MSQQTLNVERFGESQTVRPDGSGYEELDELADGGTVAGLTLDDLIACQYVNCVRPCAKPAKPTSTTARAGRQKRKNRLAFHKMEKKSRIQPPEPDEEVKKLRRK